MQTEDERAVLLRHGGDVLQELTMFSDIWDLIVEFCVGAVEWIVWLEDVLTIEPQLTIGDEELSIQVIGNSSTILYFTDHVLESLERVLNVQR